MSGNTNTPRDIMPTMSVPEQVTELLTQIRGAAESANQSGLLGILQDAVQHPEAHVSRQLEIEALRIEAHNFFGGTKGAISHLQEGRPALKSNEPRQELHDYEKFVKEYLEAHNNSTDEVIDAKNKDKNVATTNAISRLTGRVEAWDDPSANKAFIQKSLAATGTRKVTPEQLREAIGSTSAMVTESIWEVVVTGREVGAHISEPGQLEQMQTRYVNETDNSFVRATDFVTQALTELAE